MISFQTRFVTKATHTLLRSRQTFSYPAHCKGLDVVLGVSVLCVVTGGKIFLRDDFGSIGHLKSW